MRNLKTIALFSFICLGISTATFSQGNLSFHVGPSIPIMDFGTYDKNDDDSWGAGIGVNVGIKYTYPIVNNWLGIFGGIDFNYNGLQKDMKDDLESDFDLGILGKPDITYPKYFNVPLTLGLNGTWELSDNFALLANGGIAFNFFKMTDFKLDYSGQEITTEVDMATNLGFKVGCGVLIGEHFGIDVDYYALGKHDLKEKFTAIDATYEEDDEVNIDLLTVTLGYRF
jgi:opacity protein-like surface antigen